MKAVLVYWSPITRVIVPDDASEEDIAMMSRYSLREKIDSELLENIKKIVPDTECPYDPEFDKE